MSNQRVRVAVNGYGVIGKRIADAVAAQDDMDLVGVAEIPSGRSARQVTSVVRQISRPGAVLNA